MSVYVVSRKYYAIHIWKIDYTRYYFLNHNKINGTICDTITLQLMIRENKLFKKAKKHPGSFKFNELLKLAELGGFTKRKSRSGHCQYKREMHPAKLISFQPDKSNKKMAKSYQVSQLVNYLDSI